MLVEQRINNNVVLANENGEKVIVMGKGIGFKVYRIKKLSLEMPQYALIATYVASDELMKGLDPASLEVITSLFLKLKENRLSFLRTI